MLDADVPVQNLARTGASNLQVSLQVDHAIAESASAVIVNFTSCTRQEWRTQSSDQSLYQQFCDGSLVSYVIPTCTTLRGILQENSINRVREWYLEFSDLAVEVFKNQCIIERTLYKLQSSNIPWTFSSGGFEHSSFGVTKKYFEQFEKNHSAMNLWDFAITRSWRPYYHIQDPVIHKQISNYYQSWIKQNTF
jgi:hypothetical protein